MASHASPYFIGVDVGTGSARAGIFDKTGQLLAESSRPIKIWSEKPHHEEQSGTDIWNAVCQTVREAVTRSGVIPNEIIGIGFDATCSLVVLDAEANPLPVNAEGESERNIILWMDHRATDQAARINASAAPVLDYVGGRISPEMETPKLLWLAEKLPDTFKKARYFFDLTDFLTFKATGSTIRSICTVTCKWTYLAHESRWDQNYFRHIGLGSLADEGFDCIGTDIRKPGSAIPGGLSEKAAAELGLTPATAVAVGLIDAHAGAVGTIGAAGLPASMSERLAYVFGTSACTLNVTTDPVFVAGVWGPYYSALVPGLWLNEGGQSAAGAAIDHLIQMHPYSSQASQKAAALGISLTAWLEGRANHYLQTTSLAELVGSLHIVPEFLGNRAPYADPDARAIIAGLGPEDDEISLVGLYLAGLCSIGYGLRQIIDAERAKAISLSCVVVSGGAARSELVRKILADSANIAVATVKTTEPVLLGSAMLAAVASGAKRSLETAMTAMSSADKIIDPNEVSQHWHSTRYAAFELLQDTYRKIRQLN